MSARWRWLTPPGPAALSLLELEAVPSGLCHPPVPPSGVLRLVEVRRVDGASVDQAVIHGAPGSWLLSVHGGQGVRQAVTDCLGGHGLLEVEGPWSEAGPAADQRWRALARAPSPAAACWLLEHGDQSQPPFPADFLVRTPWVLITGPANAGKSTLLNAWSGRTRALVSPRPGTTRDLVSASVLMRGWRMTVVDSAGLRPAADALEAAGQTLARAARERSDLVLYLAHPEEPCTPEPADLVVLGKADLRGAAPSGALLWSALAEPAQRAERLSQLEQAVLTALRLDGCGAGA